MLNATPTRFRSRYTGKEIDQLLSSISNKIDLSYIVNNWDGGDQLVASAELAKTLFLEQQKLQDPNYIRELFLSIPDSVVFTKTDKDRLDRLAGFFQGSFANAAARNVAVSTLGFKGGELTFLVNDENGVQELSYWDIGSLTWKKSRFLPDPISAPTTIIPAGVVVGIVMDKTKYGAAKYLVKAETTSQIRAFEMLIVVKGANTYWTVYGEVGEGTLVSVENVSIAGNDVRINLRVGANTTIRFARLTEL